MATAGRKAKFTADDYLSAVKKLKTTNDKDIAKSLGVDRSRITRFRNDNPDVFSKGEEIIISFNSIRYDNITFEMFKNIPSIVEWENLMQTSSRKGLAKQTVQRRIRSIYNVTQYLKIHPDKFTVDMASELCLNLKKLGDNAPSGCRYYQVRKPIRNFFQVMHGISGEKLNTKGIEAGRTETEGQYATEKITREQRKAIEDTMMDACRKYRDNIEKEHYDIETGYVEMMGISHFMYYTATRSHGTQYLHFSDDRHRFDNEFIEFHLIDKGEGGGEHWNKILTDDGKKRIEDYLERRFKITNLDEVMKMKGVIFPLMQEKSINTERKLMRMAQENAGCVIHQPNHVWRHTFAQDALYATNWNYDLVAALGGWKTTEVLKMHYGKMSENVKKDGLKETMGIPVIKEKRFLRW